MGNSFEIDHILLDNMNPDTKQFTIELSNYNETTN